MKLDRNFTKNQKFVTDGKVTEQGGCETTPLAASGNRRHNQLSTTKLFFEDQVLCTNAHWLHCYNLCLIMVNGFILHRLLGMPLTTPFRKECLVVLTIFMGILVLLQILDVL